MLCGGDGSVLLPQGENAGKKAELQELEAVVARVSAGALTVGGGAAPLLPLWQPVGEGERDGLRARLVKG